MDKTMHEVKPDENQTTHLDEKVNKVPDKSDKPNKISRHDSLKQFLVMTDDKGEMISLENNGLDDVISKDESELTDDERMQLYEKAMSFKGLGSNNHALLCFLGCLKGLKPSSKSTFTMLPQCMTHISEIYALAGDYQRAVEFMQGTKLYYETAIIESGLQVDKYKDMSSECYSPLDFDPCLDEAKRANEYERLANSCLEQRKFQLALEYCGKATKLRQKAYGDEHPLTVKSLDLFTLIYAEMGKSQYSEAMSKVGDIVKEMREEKELQEKGKKDEVERDEILEGGAQANQEELLSNGKVDDNKNTPTEKQTEERDGKDEEEEEEEEEKERTKKVHFDEKTKEGETKQMESTLEQLTPRTMLFFFLVSAMVAILITTGWCYVSDSPVCPTRRYFYAKAKFFYYYYLVPTNADMNYL